MRIRNINFWQGRITHELAKPPEKQFTKLSFLPRNYIEEQNFQIAMYFTNIKNKQINNSKVA